MLYLKVGYFKAVFPKQNICTSVKESVVMMAVFNSGLPAFAQTLELRELEEGFQI